MTPIRIRIAIVLLILTQLVGTTGALAQEVPELQINSKRYIVVDMDSGEVFAQRGARDKVAIASLTKVFTAAQAMEMAPLDTPITTADSDLRSPEGDYFGSAGTLMGFGVGETYTLEDMIYGMLLPSGNDAANAIARTLGARPGDSATEATQRFMDAMNQRFEDLGLRDTHLVNPHGWGVPNHFSSAWDVAAFARYLADNETLLGIMGAKKYVTSNELLSLSNTNRLLTDYAPIVGGKTGYDLDAGYCLLNIASQQDRRMIAVTLDGIAPGDWYDDNRVLLEYGFDQKSALLAANDPFDGDVVSFIDPAVAELARAGGPSGSRAPVAGAVSAPGSGATDPAPVVPGTDETAGDPRTAVSPGAATWMLATLAIALVGYRGLLSFNRPTPSRRHVDMSSEAA
ncbi:MAG: D-alanyl-D-alanine carboxypeptidase [Chloroflexia bacterium]|nr:D-alanyl-D-alanine carboxypeptidase [Chloroflexia bacterium]